jgi:hypothetical protein
MRSCRTPRLFTRWSNAAPKIPIAIADEQLERSVLTEGLDDLLRCPYGVRMGGYVHVEYPPPFEREHDEDIEHIERHRSER